VESIAEAAAVIVERLEEAGIAATIDNRDFNPPGVYVAAPTILFSQLDGYKATFDLFCAVPNAGRSEALQQLSDLVIATRAVWGTDAAYPIELLVPDQTDPLPAYRLPVTVQITTK